MAARIRKGDMVEVVVGRDRGKRGAVLRIDTARERVFVERLNIVKKHQKPTATTRQGGIISKEAPMHVSNLALADPKDGKPTRIGFKFVGEGRDRKKVRIAKRSGVEIDG